MSEYETALMAMYEQAWTVALTVACFACVLAGMAFVKAVW